MTTDRARISHWVTRIATISGAVALAGCGAAGSGGIGNGASGSPTPSPSASLTPAPTASSSPSGGVTIAALTTMAQQEASEAHDPGVHVADAVLTTRQAAVTLTSGDLVNSNEAVYLVQLVGSFTLTDVSIPPGGSAPTGTALSLDVDVSNGDVVDTGLAHKSADLSKLGPVIVLSW